MHTVWKSRGSVHEVAAKFWQGKYIDRGCENFGGRVHLFGVLLHFYLQVLQKILREGTLLHPPHPPPLCASIVRVLAIIAPLTGIGHFSKQNLYLFDLKWYLINWLVWGEDEGPFNNQRDRFKMCVFCLSVSLSFCLSVSLSLYLFSLCLSVSLPV
jgi:hypothetical protein